MALVFEAAHRHSRRDLDFTFLPRPIDDLEDGFEKREAYVLFFAIDLFRTDKVKSLRRRLPFSIVATVSQIANHVSEQNYLNPFVDLKSSELLWKTCTVESLMMFESDLSGD